jgi:hypothetical protein
VLRSPFPGSKLDVLAIPFLLLPPQESGSPQVGLARVQATYDMGEVPPHLYALDRGILYVLDAPLAQVFCAGPTETAPRGSCREGRISLCESSGGGGIRTPMGLRPPHFECDFQGCPGGARRSL